MLGAFTEELDWEALYSDRLPRVYNYFRFRVGADAEAEDLTARTFEKAWQARERYRQDLAGFSTWLFSIAHNVAVDFLRSRRPQVSLDAMAELAAHGTPEEDAARDSDLRRLSALADTFAPAGSVSDRPCPPAALANSVVRAIPIDYEAVAIARSPLYGELDLTRRDVYLAMAKWIPDPSRPGAVHENPNTSWGQIDASLGREPIEMLGPPLSSPTGRSMIALLMQGGCDTYSWIAALKSTHPHRYARICRTVRTDGVYVETSDSESARLLAEPNALGILGYWGLTHSGQSLSVSKLDGVRPTLQTIESGTYAASRELYLCFNRKRTNATVMLRLAVGESPMSALIWLSLAQRRAAFLDALHN